MVTDETVQFQITYALITQVGALLDLDELQPALVQSIATLTGSPSAVLFSADADSSTLTLRAQHPASDDATSSLTIDLDDSADAVVTAWRAGKPMLVRADELSAEAPLRAVLAALKLERAFSAPLLRGDQLCAVVLIDGGDNRANARLIELQPAAAIVFGNARQHTTTVIERNGRMNDLEMLRKIDRELADIADENGIYDFTLDWALRLTLANAASLVLIDGEAQQVVAELGYTASSADLAPIRARHGGIIGRVARTGQPAMIANIAADPDYLPLQANIQSHLSVPVIREDRVIAVITAESRHLDAFTETHLDMVTKLAARAGIAIDNARLYDEAVQKREQLAHILRSITDVVIVVDEAHRIVLINTAAVSTFELDLQSDYTGKLFSDVFTHVQLVRKFNRAKETNNTLRAELTFGTDIIYYANFAPLPGVGWIIVMRDITPLKTPEQLKHELISNTTHDLRQPINAINAYLELIQMRLKDMQFVDPDARVDEFIFKAQNSIKNMMELILNLIESANIETGIELKMQPVPVESVVKQCLSWVQGPAETKAIEIITNVPPGLPDLAGDGKRITQIFNNIVGNAVKYTPPSGKVRFSAEHNGVTVRFIISDNGMGIHPQDQPHVFDRLYRARRPETDNIDGSGLGLAIVKKLVELHDGEVGFQSEIGVGTTFYITLPIYGTNGTAPTA